MNRNNTLARAVFLFLILIPLLLSGCGSTGVSEDNEGGITGTGNDVDCSLEINRKLKICQQP